MLLWKAFENASLGSEAALRRRLEGCSGALLLLLDCFAFIRNLVGVVGLVAVLLDFVEMKV